ncbi:SF0329 family protein [Bacillus ndiopicus]|uniref:SF0329 family protein n=1 Tax=Bacillus ndiopicus TaxID=1347368 RepID=UPI0005AB0F7E|nr:hypothetical protein [Bacillus ndiopicus]
MRFSQYQQKFESLLANSLKGKVKLYGTVHRKAHDQPGKLWITYNKQEILRADDLAFQVHVNRHYAEQSKSLPKISFNEDWEAMFSSKERQQLVQLHDNLEQQAMNNMLFPAWELYSALKTLYTLSIEEALHNANPLVQALAMLDRRVGKRRLAKLEIQHPIVCQFHTLRCQAEDIN